MIEQLNNETENKDLEPEKSKDNFAVIDIGTNSTRMLIFRNDQENLVRVNKSVRYTRMGQGVDRTGQLHPDAQKRNLEALEEYKNIAEDYDVKAFYVFGTSAMRDAENTQEFTDQVKEKLGLDIEVISGEDEAELGFIGVSQSFNEKLLIFDIGGGSTEFIFGENNELKKMISINLGCVRATEKYLFSDPPTFQELKRLNEDIYAELMEKVGDFIPQRPYKLIGIGGTATSLSTIKQGLRIYDSEKVHESIITRDELEAMIEELSGKTIEERQNIAGLEAKRADIILAGALILLNIFKVTGEKSFTVSDFDNLEGAAYRHFVLKNKLK
ncbi:MAG: Ppx/GppA family phosphatase [Eubacteriaceae bacterium]|nr:Ppx/GppA family phosphatase [Eubacteriaceae bacterium]